ncbi:MAG: alpha/beta fold hydrolase [Microbacterium sp.]|uniref:alpha/beta fold hydrolase n=1 Tax=Microbacterium sp. TaxID=51671 RepID=UPI001AC71FF3|nr:alpha/beta fold hydrolase [Microbacterium sp.]MBN9178686.1 alpha/beta fold hydrolase [Microbacterium sp.]
MTLLAPAVRRTVATGECSGPAVVLLHGFASRGDLDWPDAAWAEPFAASGRDVLVVDLPGHGDAARPLGAPAPTSAVIAALADLARAEGEIDLVGYSLGARLAWDLAQAPGVRVRRLVLGGLSPVEPFGMVDVAAARTAVATGSPVDDPLTGMITAMATAPGNDPTALLEIVEGFASEPFDPDAGAPAVPTLMIAGVDDPMAQGVDDLAVRIADESVVLLERVPGDHVAALHSPELRAAVQRFLAG